MKTLTKLVAGTIAALSFIVLSPAFAGDDHGHRHHKHKRHHHGHYYDHHDRHHRHGAYVIREAPRHVGNSIVHNHYYADPRPVYREREYYYAPRRAPAIVIGVDLPSIVIPLR